MSEVRYKVGDRVRRTGARVGGDIFAGRLGRIVDAGSAHVDVLWDGDADECAYYENGKFPLDCLEPAPPPVPEPAKRTCKHCGTVGTAQQIDVANECLPCWQLRDKQQSAQQGLGGEPPAAQSSIAQLTEVAKLLGAHRAEDEDMTDTLQRLLDERDGARRTVGNICEAKLRGGDLAGERDRLKLRVSELETDLAFWKREAVRAKGGRR